MHSITDDLRIQQLRPLLPPAILMEELPASDLDLALVADTRRAISDIIHGRDDRLLVLVGPCSIHDPVAALDYARRLKSMQSQVQGELLLVMRTYFEKPRTTVGWKGLINDPHLDGSFQINEGLRVARRLLRDIVALGLPPGTEFLDPITPQFVADLVAWAAIGARTTESQVHRELASGLSMPVGFKNGTRGTVEIAVDAVRSASHPHHFLSVTKQGLTAIVSTHGNTDCHVILRGGERGPNYDAESVASAVAQLAAHEVPARLMVDCSHANSRKQHHRQVEVARDLATQIKSGSDAVFGVMIESFLEEGRQEVQKDAPLCYGKSITDACLSWDNTVPVLHDLAAAVLARRQGRGDRVRTSQPQPSKEQ